MEETPDVHAVQKPPADGGLPKQITGPLSLGGGALAVVFGAYTYLETNFSTASEQREGIKASIQRLDYASSGARRELEIRIERIEERLEELGQQSGTDRWRGTDMRLWALKLAQQNPTITVPEADTR